MQSRSPARTARWRRVQPIRPVSMPAFGVDGACRLRIYPVEVFDIPRNLRVAEALVWHWQVVVLRKHRLGVRIRFQHLFRRLEPAREPRVAAPTGYAHEVRAKLVAFADGMAGEA